MVNEEYTGPKCMFADAAQMNAELYKNIGQKEYDVSIYYHETGLAQSIAANKHFGNFTLVVICTNATWIGTVGTTMRVVSFAVRSRCAAAVAACAVSSEAIAFQGHATYTKMRKTKTAKI